MYCTIVHCCHFALDGKAPCIFVVIIFFAWTKTYKQKRLEKLILRFQLPRSERSDDDKSASCLYNAESRAVAAVASPSCARDF